MAKNNDFKQQKKSNKEVEAETKTEETTEQPKDVVDDATLINNIFPGIKVSEIPDAEEEGVQTFKETVRTIVAHPIIINEMVENIFKPLNINEDNGLLQVLELDDGNNLLAYDTLWLSEVDRFSQNEEERVYGAEITRRNNTIIECLLNGRKRDGLLVGVKDYEGSVFKVFPDDSSIIKSSFEIVVDDNKTELAKGIRIIKDTLKVTDDELAQILTLTKRPAALDSAGLSATKWSLLLIDRSADEMNNLNTAYRMAARGKRISTKIKKNHTRAYETSKMIGQDIIVPTAETLGAVMGSLGGSVAQATGVALSEGGNEFFKAFDIKGIMNRPSTKELKGRFFKGAENTGRGGVL